MSHISEFEFPPPPPSKSEDSGEFNHSQQVLSEALQSK